jgi:hypothetical protein
VRLKLEAEQIGSARIDIGVDARGEFFDVSFVGNGDAAKLEVVDIASADRHLLLLVRNGAEKSKFLCGHDERHWFVAAVPEQARGVTGVTPAKAALQPALVSAAVARARPKDRFRRRMDGVHPESGGVRARRNPSPGSRNDRAAGLAPWSS